MNLTEVANMKINRAVLSIGLITSLAGCLDDDNNDSNYVGIECSNSQLDMAIQTISTDFTSSAVAIGCSDGGLLDNNLISTESDRTVSAGRKSFYHIGKAGIDIISSYDFLLPDVENWSYSTNDANESTSNTYKLLEVSDTKAYLIRYNKSKVWIVDPSAMNANDFKVDELDLGAYLASTDSTTSTATDMIDAVITDGKLYIAMQRLRNGAEASWGGDAYDYTNDSMIAVFDITTDLELEASPSNTTFKGITLQGRNIHSLNVFENTIYASSKGNYFDDFGLLESINTNTFEVNTVFAGSSELGAIADSAIISATQGYILTDLSKTIDDVYTYQHKVLPINLSTGQVDGALAGFDNIHLTDIEVGPNNYLWILSAVNSNPGVYKLDVTNNEEHVFLKTNLNPHKIAFKR